jgi:hypothetical protein
MKYSQKQLKALWKKFKDIPVDIDDRIDVRFHIWNKGTPRMYIWHWFDDKLSEGIGKLMYGGLK